MKKFLHFLAFAFVLAGILVLSGCEKENWGKRGSGKEVKFGAAAHSSVVTRTEYKDYTDGATSQGIKWLSSDKIRIYSPNCARRVAVEAGPETESNPYYYWADYKIDPNGTDPSKGKLINLSNDGTSTGYDTSDETIGYDIGNGLIWLNETQATFYGVYPMPSTAAGTGNTNVPGVGGTFSFSIPRSQDFSEKGDMSYAFMTSKTVAQKSDESVTMNFFPDFSAYEVFLKSTDENVKLNEFSIGIKQTDANTWMSGTSLAGPFTVNIANWSGGTTGTAKSYDYTGSSTADKKITVSMGSNGKDIPLEDAATPLHFTVLATPFVHQNLYISITATYGGGNSRTWKLDLSKSNGNTIQFPACYKHRLNGLLLPGGEWEIIYSENGMKVDTWVTDSDNNQTLVVE